jgi:hypothetical protein
MDKRNLCFSFVKWDRDKMGRLRSAKSGSNRRKNRDITWPIR